MARRKVRGLGYARSTRISDDELFKLAEQHRVAQERHARLARNLYRREGGQHSIHDFATYDGSGLLEGIRITSRPDGYFGNHRGR
jgi:hypothetical protein